MIDLYSATTPNGQKIHIMLEECGLPYDVHWVNIDKGEQFAADFLAISPNNKIPAIVDRDGPGGALMVKSGAIIPTWPPCDHVARGWSPTVGLLVYPSARRSGFTLYEDDGTSLGYRQGEFARTSLACKTTGTTVTLTIGGRLGSYAGMPATRDFTATIHLPARPGTVTLDGAAVTDYRWNKTSSTATINIPACGKTTRTLICQ